MTGLEIRRALRGEATLLSALAQASKAHWGYSAELLELWRPQLTISEESVGRQPVWCGCVADGVVGFCALAFDDDVAELEHLWVDPAWIGRGVGRALFEHAFREAEASGAYALRVVSDPHAVGFYLRMRMTQVGTHESTPSGRALPVLELPVDPG